MTFESETVRDAEARKARMAEAWAMRGAALAAGTETWDVGRMAD